jgi:hypothetical protein
MEKWREDAQPESSAWPEAAPPTRDVPVLEKGNGSFPETANHSLAGLSDDSEAYGSILSVPHQRERPTDSNALSGNERSSELRDPWSEGDNDPDEVTVQLDTPHAAGRRGTAASDVPVFVDESGRRSRTFRRIGIVVALACGAYAVVIVATLLSGNAGAPWLPVPGQDDGKPAGQVEATRAPSTTPTPGGRAGAAPRVPEVTASAAAPAGPGASTGPSASGTAAAPSDTPATGPSPSTSTGPGPAPSTSTADPGPSNPAVGGSASPQPPASSPSASPSSASSPSPAGGSTTTVAGGAAEPAGAAADPQA